MEVRVIWVSGSPLLCVLGVSVMSLLNKRNGSSEHVSRAVASDLMQHEEWRLFVKVLVAEPPLLHVLEHASSGSVGSLLSRLQAVCAEPTANLSLVYDGAELPHEAVLRACGLTDGATVHVICKRRTLRLRERDASDDTNPVKEAWPASASVARRLRLDAARWRGDGAAPGAWSGRDALARLQHERTETIVPSATPGTLLRAPPAIASSRGQRLADGAAVLSEEDSEAEEVDGRTRASVDMWPAAQAASSPPAELSAPEWTPLHDEPPDDCLQLEWAAGFSPNCGLGCAGGNEVVYGCGAIVVVHSAASQRLQRHLLGHRATVRAVCVHPHGRIVAGAAGAATVDDASGHVGDDVLVWDGATAELLGALRSRAAIVQLAFSPNGEVLACLNRPAPPAAEGKVDTAEAAAAMPPVVSLWRWRKGEHFGSLGSAALDGVDGPCRALLWHRPVGGGADRLVLMARRSLLLWAPPGLSDRELSVASHGIQGPPAGRLRTAAALSTGMIVTGDREGELQLWSAATLLQRTQAHTGAVRAIAVAPDGVRFASGGADGAVQLWDRHASRMQRIDLATRLAVLLDPLGRAQTAAGNALPAVCSMTWLTMNADQSDEALAIGTRHGELHAISLRRPHQPPAPMQRSPAASRYPHALAAHPTALQFATVGGDDYIRLWSIGGAGPRATLLSMQPLLRPCACVAFDGKGARIVVGEVPADAGHRPRFHVLSADSLRVQRSVPLPALKKSSSAADATSAPSAAAPAVAVRRGVSVLRFSPNERLLAAGSTDGALYVYDVTQQFALLGPLLDSSGVPAHAARLVGIDWSDDSTKLRSGCAAGTEREDVKLPARVAGTHV